MASIFIKPTVAFNCGDTFVFGSWVCTADGAGCFQCRLTMTPNPKTGLVTLPEVITGNFIRVDNRVTQVPPTRARDHGHHEATSRSPADGGRNRSRGE
jgi:hypothetical protein